MPPAPPVLLALSEMLSAEDETDRTVVDAGMVTLAIDTHTTGSWNVTSTVNSEPPKSSEGPPATGGPFVGSTICSRLPVIIPLSTLFDPSCGATGAVARSQMRSAGLQQSRRTRARAPKRTTATR